MNSRKDEEIDRRPLLICEGDSLQDVLELLERIGVEPLICEKGHISSAEAARRLVIVDAETALSLDLSTIFEHPRTLRIAITSIEASSVADRLRRLGYHYVIQRPVHEQSVQSLIFNILHEGQDRRTTPRASLGAHARIQLRSWSWPEHCLLVDLSVGGCLVATRSGASINQRVRLHLDQELMQGPSMILAGKVARSRADKSSGEWWLGVRFTDSVAARQWQLEELMGRAIPNPHSRLKPSPWQDLKRALNALMGRDPTSRPPPRSAPASAYDLDDPANRVTVLLSGYELTLRGVRLRHHPQLRVGSRVLAAIHDQVRQRRIRIPAEVISDREGHGFALRFLETGTPRTGEVAALVQALNDFSTILTVAIEGDRSFRQP
jgi:hypothetical protein